MVGTVNRFDAMGGLECDNCANLVEDETIYSVEELSNPGVLVLCDRCWREEQAERMLGS